MKKPTIRASKGPERIIQDDLTIFLELRGWHVMETNGNAFQRGFPDLYVVHKIHKWRWVECKNLENYRFTQAQLDHFPFIQHVWILVAATQSEYEKLWKPPNWRLYLKGHEIVK